MELFSNVHLWAAAGGWFMAQLIKIVTTLITKRKFQPLLFFSSGGMPSSHAAAVCALCTIVALTEPDRLASPLFGVCCVFAYVIMYDAAGIRRAAGEHAKVINKLQRQLQDPPEQRLKELLGHSPVQVLCGALLGIAVGFAVGFFSGRWVPYAA